MGLLKRIEKLEEVVGMGLPDQITINVGLEETTMEPENLPPGFWKQFSASGHRLEVNVNIVD